MPRVQDYLNLIPPPNRIQPKFMAWVAAAIQPLVDVQNVLRQEIVAFDIETAIGAQLDVLGQILNRSRILNFQPTEFFNAANAIPILVNYDTPGNDLTIYQETGKAVFLVGIQLVTDLACDVTFKSGSTTLVTYEFNVNSGLVQNVQTENPGIMCNTEVSAGLVIHCDQVLAPFEVYVVTE